ncbi:MAG: SMI1/KNR4 family protein [Candidatus Omnitrophica bacterium]|nr:SMI1/KNR4 family protein [Candidatus Omnitrophota bacterium]
MPMESLSLALDLISKHPDECDFEGPKTEELVSQAEHALGLKFPPTYRAFLKKLGCGDVAGEEFYGIVDENFEESGIPDAVWFTLEERKRGGLAASLVIIAALGDGELLALDTAPAAQGGEGSVILLPEGYSRPGAALEVIAEDFGEFFFRTVRDALGDE